MPFIIGAILMTQLKAFKGSTKKSVDEVIEREEELEEKGTYDLRSHIDKIRDEEIDKKYQEYKSEAKEKADS